MALYQVFVKRTTEEKWRNVTGKEGTKWNWRTVNGTTDIAYADRRARFYKRSGLYEVKVVVTGDNGMKNEVKLT